VCVSVKPLFNRNKNKLFSTEKKNLGKKKLVEIAVVEELITKISSLHKFITFYLSVCILNCSKADKTNKAKRELRM